MSIINFIFNNWQVIVGLLIILVIIIYAIVAFIKKPKKDQIANLKQWLYYAVLEAEKSFSDKSGMGSVKLRMVYDATISKFPWVAFVRFETFSGWVDEALGWMKNTLAENREVESYVENK